MMMMATTTTTTTGRVSIELLLMLMEGWRKTDERPANHPSNQPANGPTYQQQQRTDVLLFNGHQGRSRIIRKTRVDCCQTVCLALPPPPRQAGCSNQIKQRRRPPSKRPTREGNEKGGNEIPPSVSNKRAAPRSVCGALGRAHSTYLPTFRLNM